MNHKKRKNQKLKMSRFSQTKVIIYALVFACIGIVIWKSFAANPLLSGDINNDGTVNVTDLSILLSKYNSADAASDINNDGVVNVFDLSILLSNYGRTGSVYSALGSALPARLPQSSGTTYYVDGTLGNDAGDGSAAAPWKTINHALSSVPPSGSIIRVKPGTYYSSPGSYVINFNRAGDVNNPITLMADQPGTVFIQNSDTTNWTIGAWIHSASGLRIQDLTFKILADQGVGGSASNALIENSSRIELYNDTFNEVGGVGIQCRGGPLASTQQSNDVWLLSNTFRPSGSNVYAQVTGLAFPNNVYGGSKGSHWIYAGQFGQDPADNNWDHTNGCNRFVVANNVFLGSTAGRDVELGPQCRNSFIVDNTFYGNHSLQVIGVGDPTNDASAEFAGQGVEVFSNTATMAYANGYNIVTNNLFVDLFGHAAYGSGATEPGNIIQKNLAYQTQNNAGYDGDKTLDYQTTWGTSTLFSLGSGNYADTNPLFVNPSGYDYHLQAGSPAIGKADPAYSFPVDITGKARNTTPDLGAYEH